MSKNDPDCFSEYIAFSWTSFKAMLDNRLIASTYIWILIILTLMTFTENFPDRIDIFHLALIHL